MEAAQVVGILYGIAFVLLLAFRKRIGAHFRLVGAFTAISTVFLVLLYFMPDPMIAALGVLLLIGNIGLILAQLQPDKPKKKDALR